MNYIGKTHPINRHVVIEWDGKLASIGEHAEAAGRPLPVVLERLRKGWSIPKTFEFGENTSLKKHHVITEDQIAIAALHGISQSRFMIRVLYGWRPDEAATTPNGGTPPSHILPGLAPRKGKA